MSEISAYHQIRTKISSLFYFPGQIISEAELCASLHTPRHTIRNAISKLSQEGLVIVIPQRGTCISKIDHKRTLSSIFIIRSLLQAIGRTTISDAACRNEETTIEMKEIISFMIMALSNGNFEDLYRFDNQFHLTLSGLASFKRVSLIISNERVHLERTLRLENNNEADFKRLIDSNLKILTGIESKNESIFHEGVHEICSRLENAIQLLKDTKHEYLSEQNPNQLGYRFKFC